MGGNRLTSVINRKVIAGGRLLRHPDLSTVFDPVYYGGQLGHSFDLKTGVAHYLEVGASAGLDPHLLFSTAWYLNSNADVARGGINPLEHYLAHGFSEGREPHPLFHSRHIEKAGLDPASGLTPLARFIACGSERRVSPGPLFDVEYFESQVQVVLPTLQHLKNFLTGPEKLRNPNPIFDSLYYLSLYPDVARAGIHAFIHYINGGWRERQPHPLFDAIGYAARMSSAGPIDRDPITHYRLNGAADLTNPHPLFDVAYYKKRVEVPPNELAVENYIRHGCRPGRDPNRLFDSEWYLSTTPSIAESGRDFLTHYILDGEQRGDRPHPLFDPKWYRSSHPELLTGLGPTKGGLLAHFVEVGLEANLRSSPLFDNDFYARRHPHAPGGSSKSALIDYLEHGGDEGFDPNPFFENGWYASQNDLSGKSALEHFIIAGESDGVLPHRLWNEDLYLESNPDLRRALDAGVVRTPYEQFVTDGGAEIASSADNRRFTFQLGEFLVDLQEKEYLEDNPDAKMAVVRGDYRSGVEHFFGAGYTGIDEGLRPVYSKERFTKFIRREGADARASELRHGCFFAHYDQDGVIDDYVINYIKALRNLGVETHFISATTDNEELAKIRPHVVSIIVKNGSGRDFGSWLVAWNEVDPELIATYEYLIFVNDSIYFPIVDPKPMFEAMNLLRYNVWGITDSRDWSYGQYHVQSYFLAFDRVAREQLVPKLMDLVARRQVLTKRGQIVDFEFGFTRMAVEENLSVGAFCSPDDIREDVLRDHRMVEWKKYVQFGLDGLNPTLELWDLLIKFYKCPMVKLQQLRDNPRALPNVRKWPELVDPRYLDPSIVRMHLERVKGRRLTHRAAPGASFVQPGPGILIKNIIQGVGFGFRRDLVLLAHHDPDGIVDPYIFTSIDGYNRAGCDVAVVTAIEGDLQLERLRAVAAAVVQKNPVGRDFGSWSAAVTAFPGVFDQYESVIWVNDSFYFPLFDPKVMFSDMRNRNLDFWGVVDSHQLRWHAMSWFWSIGPRIRKQGFFEWYQAAYNPHYTKWSQIKNYEMRIPLMMKSQGYSADVYVKARDVLNYVQEFERSHPKCGDRLDFTMTHDFWDVIIEKFHCPALKVELLRDNPLGMNLGNLYDIISRTDYDPSIIRNHIGRMNMHHLGAR